MSILLFEDKLGITPGYMDMWENFVFKAGLRPYMFKRQSLWRSEWKSRQLLIQKGNRKSPGFNPEYTAALERWMTQKVTETLPDIIAVMDIALFGIFEPNWDNAQMDNLRGGVYHKWSRTVLIMTPISAVNKNRQLKDIRMANEGAESKDDWEAEEHDPNELFFEPYTIRSGRWIFQQDLAKLARLYSGIVARKV